MERSTRSSTEGAQRTPTVRSAADEREALARDLHAGLAQATTATMLGLEILRSSMTADAPPPPDVIGRLEELAIWSGREVRRLLAFLRVPRDAGLPETLRQYVDEVDHPDAPIELSVGGAAASPETSEAVFRFIHGTLGVLFRKRSTGPISVAVVASPETVTVRIRARATWPNGSHALDGIARDAGAEPVVVRSNGGTLSIEAVIR